TQHDIAPCGDQGDAVREGCAGVDGADLDVDLVGTGAEADGDELSLEELALDQPEDAVSQAGVCEGAQSRLASPHHHVGRQEVPGLLSGSPEIPSEGLQGPS